MQRGGAVDRVHVEPEVDQQRHGINAVSLGGVHELGRAPPDRPLPQGRIGGQHPPGLRPVPPHRRGDEHLHIVEPRARPGRLQLRDDLRISPQRCLLQRRAASVDGVAGPHPVRVDAVAEQQPHAAGESVMGGADQQILEHLARGGMLRLEQSVPGAAVTRAQPELEQQLDPGVVGIPLTVVERLRIVGVGPVLEQQPGQSQAVGVRR